MSVLLLAAALALPAHLPAPGGVAVIALGEHAAAPTVRYGDRPVLVVDGDEGWVALVGISLWTGPGPQRLEVDGVELTFTVEPRDYATQRLTIANERMVNPLPEDLARIESERPRLARARTAFTDDAPAGFRLVPPAEGPRSSAFGLRRILNGEPRAPHSGIDIAAPQGAPVTAPAPGRVIEVGAFYYTGNTVFVDHGRGFITAYYHLDEAGVAVGDELAVGDPIGTVGSTGRVTGPHLHFVVLLNGEMVDPDLFLDAGAMGAAASGRPR